MTGSAPRALDDDSQASERKTPGRGPGREGRGAGSQPKPWRIFIKFQAFQKVLISKEISFILGGFWGLPLQGRFLQRGSTETSSFIEEKGRQNAFRRGEIAPNFR